MTISAVVTSTNEIPGLGANGGLLRASPSAPPDRSTSASAPQPEVGGPPRWPRRGRCEGEGQRKGEREKEEHGGQLEDLLQLRLQMR